jgi:hypothetical protein
VLKTIPKPSPALAISIAAMAVAIGGTTIFAQAGGGNDTGKIVGYAQVKADGDVRAKRSLNVNNSNVTVETGSVYCFRNLSFSFKGLQATVDYDSSNTEQPHVQGAVKGPGGCGGDGEVTTADALGPAPEPFFVVFYK